MAPPAVPFAVPPQLPTFDATPVFSTVDCTTVLLPGCAWFDAMSNYLLWPDTHPRPDLFEEFPIFPGELRPRLSAAAEAAFTWKKKSRTGRALICFANRRRAISITLRSVAEAEKNEEDGPDSLPGTCGCVDVPSPVKSAFAASEKYDPAGEPVWFSIKDHVRGLWKALKNDATDQRPSGLVVLTGSTDSSKTLIARGLIDEALASEIERGKKVGMSGKKPRRPHLVTFEDPIEKFYAEVEKPRHKASGAGRARRCKEGSYHCAERLRIQQKYEGESAILLARYLGVDYTPRERGKDVHDLAQGFADALRQTPTVYYIGEVRERDDWRAVLEFAGTGHLVVTTAHAGSLLEAMTKLLAAVDATTPATRRQWAAKMLGVVHLRSLGRFWDTTDKAKPTERRLLLPALWRRTPAGLASLSVNGLGAVVPTYTDDESVSSTSCLGRRHFLERMATDRKGGIHSDDIPALRRTATDHDLRGE